VESALTAKSPRAGSKPSRPLPKIKLGPPSTKFPKNRCFQNVILIV